MGKWDCFPNANGSRINCNHYCHIIADKVIEGDKDDWVKTGAWSSCGHSDGQWTFKKLEKAKCRPCSSNPAHKYPIAGGKWNCVPGWTTKCTAECDNGVDLPGMLKCSRTFVAPEGQQEKTNNWKASGFADKNNISCDVSHTCQEAELKEMVPDGVWQCAETSGTKTCFHFCTVVAGQELAEEDYIKTWARADCPLGGVWKIKKKSAATCTPCSSDPHEKFPVGGNGWWDCNVGAYTKCNIKCPGKT